MTEVKRPFLLPSLERASRFSVSREFCQYRSIHPFNRPFSLSPFHSLSLSPMIDLRRPGPGRPSPSRGRTRANVTPLFFRLGLGRHSPSLFSPFLQSCTFLRSSLFHHSLTHEVNRASRLFSTPLSSVRPSVGLPVLCSFLRRAAL